MRWPPLLVLLALLALLLVPLSALASPQRDLEGAVEAYNRSEFGQVIELVRPLLYPKILLSRQEQVIQAYKLLGISYVFEKNRNEAEKQFLAMLSLKPDFSLDPLVDPAAAVSVFEEVKQRNAEKIQAILQRERREEQRRRQEAERRREEERQRAALARQPRLVLERTIVEHPYWINFLPLGAGQLQNGQRTKGYIIMSAQLGLGAVSLGTAMGLYLSYPDGKVPEGEYDMARALNVVQVVTGAVCLASVLYGIIDALVYYRPRTVREKRLEQKSAWYVSPAPSGLGLGLTF